MNVLCQMLTLSDSRLLRQGFGIWLYAARVAGWSGRKWQAGVGWCYCWTCQEEGTGSLCSDCSSHVSSCLPRSHLCWEVMHALECVTQDWCSWVGSWVKHHTRLTSVIAVTGRQGKGTPKVKLRRRGQGR